MERAQAVPNIVYILRIAAWVLLLEGVAEFYGSATTFAGYVAPLLFGTVLAAVIALIVAVPLAWGIALLVSHYAPRAIATPIAYVIDLLAAAGTRSRCVSL